MKMNTPVMRATVLAACIVRFGVSPAVAQNTTAPAAPTGATSSGWSEFRDPAQMEARHLQTMIEHLKLTPDEVIQIKAIKDDRRMQMTALLQDTLMQQDDKRARMMTMWQESEGEIRGVLTDEQKPK